MADEVVAQWQGVEIARSAETMVVEGNHYFPAASVNQSLLEPSDHHSSCHWKGEASYYHVVVNGQRNDNAAWYYPAPKAAASAIHNHVAFWKGVTVSKV